MAPVSAIEPDPSREAKAFFTWSPPRSLLAALRSYEKQRSQRGPWPAFVRRLAVLRHGFWSVIAGADIPLGLEVGRGLLIPHPNGIVVHPNARIGVNCLLFQQVTIGDRDGGVPTLGGHVDVGAGAKVLGCISIGDHARIGANAVVLDDVPPGCTVAGIPARVVAGPG